MKPPGAPEVPTNARKQEDSAAIKARDVNIFDPGDRWRSLNFRQNGCSKCNSSTNYYNEFPFGAH